MIVSDVCTNLKPRCMSNCWPWFGYVIVSYVCINLKPRRMSNFAGLGFGYVIVSDVCTNLKPKRMSNCWPWFRVRDS